MEQAVANADKDLTATPDADQAPDTGADQEPKDIDESLETKSDAQTTNDMLDLAKLGKFKVDGQEMTFDELKRAILRQQDYTKKTQTLAEERKFIDNLDADLEAVKKNPALAEQFRQIYPEKFHRYLRFAMSEQAKAEGQPKAPDQQGQPALPPEVLERLERAERASQQVLEKHQAQVKKTLETTFSTLEAEAQKKFKYADMIHVYGAISDHFEANNIDAETLLDKKDALEKLFTQLAKASHEQRLKDYEGWKASELEKVKANNSKAQDIGSGGGTPSGAPKQYTGKGMFQNVADDVVAALNNT